MVFFCSTTCPEGVTYARAVHNLDGMLLLNEGYCHIMPGGRHQCRSIKILRAKDGVEWSGESLRMCHVFRVHGNPISPAQAVKLYKKAHISTAIVKRKAAFTDTTESSLSYAGAIEEDYSVRFFDMRILDFVENIMSSNFFVEISRSAYMPYLSICIKTIKRQDVFPLF